MKRLWRILVIIGIVGVLGYTSSIEAYAFLQPDGSGDNKVEFWNQGYPAEAIHPGTGCSFQSAGCSTYSALYIAVKTGHIDPKKGENIDTFKVLAREKNMYWTNPNYYFAYDRINELYSDIEYVGRKLDDGVVVDASMAYDDAITCIKKYMSDGYYVMGVINVTGTDICHCIFFDGINEDGTLSIGDSGYSSGITMESLYSDKYPKTSMFFSYVEIMTCKDKPCNKQPSIYDGNALREGSGGSEEKTDDEKEIDLEYANIVKEWQLKGMPKQSALTSDIPERLVSGLLPEWAQLELPDMNSLASIQENMKADKISLFSIANTLLSYVGILLIIYAILLSLAYYFDVFNPIDISLLGVLTAGNIKVIKYDDDLSLVDKPEKQGYMKSKKIFIIIGIIFAMGCLLISGGILSGLYKLVYQGLEEGSKLL